MNKFVPSQQFLLHLKASSLTWDEYSLQQRLQQLARQIYRVSVRHIYLNHPLRSLLYNFASLQVCLRFKASRLGVQITLLITNFHSKYTKVRRLMKRLQLPPPSTYVLLIHHHSDHSHKKLKLLEMYSYNFLFRCRSITHEIWKYFIFLSSLKIKVSFYQLFFLLVTSLCHSFNIC